MVVSTKIPLKGNKPVSVETDTSASNNSINEKIEENTSLTDYEKLPIDKDTLRTIKVLGLSFIIAFFFSWLLFFLVRPEWTCSDNGEVNVGKTIIGGIVVGFFVMFLAYAFLILQKAYIA